MVHYDTTVQGVMGWANSELEHIGRIVSLEDPDLAYSYAQSTLYSMAVIKWRRALPSSILLPRSLVCDALRHKLGMAHLKDALFQMVNDDAYEHHKKDLLTIHAKVIKAMKHLIKDFDLDLEAIKSFNTRHVLSNLSYLKSSKSSKKTRKNRRN